MKIENSFVVDSKIKEKCMWGMGIGIIALVAAYFVSPARFWLNLLINNFYFITLALSGTFFLALQFVTNSSWMRTYQRIPEAMSRFLPYSLLLMLVMYFGIHYLYEWSHEHLVHNDPILVQKIAYLNVPFFMGRLIFIILGWILFSKLIYSKMEQIKNGNSLTDTGSSRATKVSAIFLVFFALSFSFASYDWIMSLEPHWFSTIFSLYTFSSLFVGGIAFITLSLIVLNKLGYLKEVITEDHFHDLGKWLMGMSTFWAYIWFSQYMLIWYSNIPEETEYFILRNSHTWDWLFWINFIVNWLIPFAVLLPRSAKRNSFILSRVSVLILVGRWLDIYLLTAPKVLEENKLQPYVSLIEIFIALGFASLFVMIFMKSLSKKSLIKSDDPYFDEGLHLHQ